MTLSSHLQTTLKRNATALSNSMEAKSPLVHMEVVTSAMMWMGQWSMNYSSVLVRWLFKRMHIIDMSKKFLVGLGVERLNLELPILL